MRGTIKPEQIPEFIAQFKSLMSKDEKGDLSAILRLLSEITAATNFTHSPDCAVGAWQSRADWISSLDLCDSHEVIAELSRRIDAMFLPAIQVMTEATHAPFDARRLVATQNAIKRHISDPKNAAKIQAHELWLDWQSGRILFKSGAAFARHIVESSPVESTKTVEKWITRWRLDTKHSAS